MEWLHQGHKTGGQLDKNHDFLHIKKNNWRIRTGYYYDRLRVSTEAGNKRGTTANLYDDDILSILALFYGKFW